MVKNVHNVAHTASLLWWECEQCGAYSFPAMVGMWAMRRIYASLGWWGEGGYPYIPTMVPWEPYYPVVYSLACLPGWSMLNIRSCRESVLSPPVRSSVRDRPWGSNLGYPMGREPWCTSGS